MRLTRCFVEATLRAGTQIVLNEQAALHVARVLRARVGQALTLFDGSGGEFEAEIVQIDRRAVRVAVGAHHAIERESPLSVTLLQALARGERMDFVVQKACELGAARLVAFTGARSVVRLSADALTRRTEHWRAIAISACEQCGRNRIPSIELARDLATACAAAPTDAVRLLLDPQATASLPSLVRAARAVVLLIGAEGGLSGAEIELALRCGFQSCRLGPRVLRAESAPLAALAAIQAIAGDFHA